MWPEKPSVSTVVMMVGTPKARAALASATALFFSVWRSIDCTPKAICGWWSMRISWQASGVSSSGLAVHRSSSASSCIGGRRSGFVQQPAQPRPPPRPTTPCPAPGWIWVVTSAPRRSKVTALSRTRASGMCGSRSWQPMSTGTPSRRPA